MANEILNKIRIALGMSPLKEFKFSETAVLEDGTTVTADTFEVGKMLYTLDLEGNAVLAKANTYTVNDKILTVDETGTITDVADVVVVSPEIESLKEQISQMLDVLASLAEKVKSLEDSSKASAQTMEAIQEKFSSIPAGKLITERKGAIIKETRTSYEDRIKARLKTTK